MTTPQTSSQSPAPPTYNEALTSPTSPPPTQVTPPKNPAPPPPQPQPQIAHTQGGVAYIVNPQPVLMTTRDVMIIKNAYTFHPYPEYCPKCQQEHDSYRSPPRTPAVPQRYVAFPPPQPQLMHTQGGVAYIAYPQPNFVLDEPIVKVAPTFDPYPEYCPRCRVVIITRREWSFGICACIVLIVALCIPPLWPLLILLCTSVVKDAHHYCPFCYTLLAIRKR